MKDGEVNEGTVMDALAAEVTVFFQSSAEDVSQRFGRHVSETLRPHQQRADDLIELIRRAAAELFEIPYHAPESSEAFEMKRRPYWVQRKHVSESANRGSGRGHRQTTAGIASDKSTKEAHDEADRSAGSSER